MKRILAALLTCCLVVLPATGHNNYFLPGDAFFSVSISQQLIEQWSDSKEKSFTFRYSRFDGEFFACGNIGYGSLSVEDITPELRAALAEAYWHFVSGTRPIYREEGDDGESKLEQVNSVVALIYPKSFDLKLPLGLKFNEDWPTQGGGRYGGFFESAKAVAIDWRLAAQMPSLPIREKLAPLAHLAENYDIPRVIGGPLHIDSKDIQIILVGFTEQKGYEVTQRCPNLEAILESEDGAEYAVVTAEQVRMFRCGENGAWEETVIKFPVAADKSWIPKRATGPVVPTK